jgi:hypothetical protein
LFGYVCLKTGTGGRDSRDPTVPSSYASNIEAITEAGEVEVGALVKSTARVKPEAEPRDERDGMEARPMTVKYWAVLNLFHHHTQAI